MRKGYLLAVIFSFVLVLLGVTPVYAAEPASIQFEIHLDITGDIPSSAKSFTFVLEAIDNAPMPERDTLRLTGTESGKFSPIAYSKPGTYHYTVCQVIGDTNGYVYDDTVYDLDVYVTTDDSGSLDAVIWAYEAGDSEKTDEILFTNQYLSESGETPQTGDTSKIGFWITISAACLLGLAVVAADSYKTHNNSGSKRI